MKLASFKVDDRHSFGIVRDKGIVDLGQRVGDRFADLKALLAAGGAAALGADVRGAEADLALADVSLDPVIPNPGAIWCAAINTHSHFDEAKERMGAKGLPEKPVLFLRATSTLVGSGDYMEKPATESMFDYEGEIALVIGKRCRNVDTASALDAVAGYAAFNDGSARQYQMSSSQVTAGKNAWRSGGFGPWLATPDEVDLATMTMTCRVNDQQVQHMGLDDLIFSFAELIAFISEFTWLEPGDVIVTGSPFGVGVLREPPLLLREGDRVEVEVSGVGVLVNSVQEQRAD